MGRLLTMKEFVAMTNFSPAKGYRMAQRKELETVRDGRSVRIPEEAYAQWLARRTVKAEPDQAA